MYSHITTWGETINALTLRQIIKIISCQLIIQGGNCKLKIPIKTKGIIFNNVEIQKSYNDFVSNLRSAVRGFWSGMLSEGEFVTAFNDTIDFRLREAYQNIANKYGIGEDEFTESEQNWIDNFIIEQIMQTGSFTDAILENAKPAGKLTPLLDRVELWANRYNQVENNAITFFGENQKLVWNVTANKVHCVNCARLEGYVKRASQWRDYPLEPQSPYLACGGYRCGCSLDETDSPMSRGTLPRP